MNGVISSTTDDYNPPLCISDSVLTDTDVTPGPTPKVTTPVAPPKGERRVDVTVDIFDFLVGSTVLEVLKWEFKRKSRLLYKHKNYFMLT